MSSVHLLVLIHGMWGNPSHLFECERVILEVKGGQEKEKEKEGEVKLETLVARANQEESTYDGIDWGAERVVEEIEAKIKAIEGEGRKVTKFSVIGYSLGGLLARYVLGILHQKQLFETIKPMNFATVATPHLGLLRYNTFYSTLSFILGPVVLSRTGDQFFGVDSWSTTGLPLLEVMADPDRIFYQALALFPNVRIYANGINDQTVPYASAGIVATDPFAGHETSRFIVEWEPNYKPIVRSFRLTEEPEPSKGFLATLSKYGPENVLPPSINYGFPLNIIPYLLFPIIFPVLFTLAISRLALDARSSRARIRILETSESARNKLLHRIVKWDKKMEDRLGVDKWDKRLERGVERIERSFSNFERGLAKFERGVEGRVADMMNEDETRARNRKTRERARGESTSGWVKEASDASTVKDDEREAITAPQDTPSTELIPSESSLPLPTPPASPPDSTIAASPSILDESMTDSPLTSSVQVPQHTNGTDTTTDTNTTVAPPPNPAGPILSASQLRMVKWLNSVPTMKKHVVFLDNLRNSHGTIVCRDMETYDFHKRGEGVLKHWADGYLL